MLPLLTASRPESSASLWSQLESGLTSLFHGTVQIHAGPDSLAVHLDAPELAPLEKIPWPAHPESSSPVLQVRLFTLHANNALLWSIPFSLESHFKDAAFVWAAGTATHSALLLGNAHSGQIHLRIDPKNLERLANHHLGTLAAAQGFELLESTVEVTPCDAPAPNGAHREIQIQWAVKARAFIMNTALTLSGRARITEDLHLAFSALHCDGQGMAVTAARSFLAPTFKKLEAQPLPIASFIPPGVPLRSVELECGSHFGILASFGPN